MYTRARAAPLSLRHTGGKGQTKGEGAGRPEELPPPPRAMADAAEAAFSPRAPPSRCGRRAPCPRPRVRSPRAPPPALARPRAPSPRRFRRASGLGCAPSGSGRRRVGAAADRLGPARATPTPSARAGQVSAAAGRVCSESTGHPASSAPRLAPSGGADRRSDPASGGRRGVSLSRGLFGASTPRGRAPAWRGLGTGGAQPLGRSWQGPGRGDRRREAGGPLSELREVQGGRGAGPGARGDPGKLSGNVCWLLGETLPLGRGALLLLLPLKVADFRTTRGKQAGRDGRERDREDRRDRRGGNQT